MATLLDDMIRKTRPLRMKRAEAVIVPREMEVERQMFVRRADVWWQRQGVRDFSSSFVIFFTGAMIFLM